MHFVKSNFRRAAKKNENARPTNSPAKKTGVPQKNARLNHYNIEYEKQYVYPKDILTYCIFNIGKKFSALIFFPKNAASKNRAK